MRVEQYFERLQAQIDACLPIVSTSITYEKRDPMRGFVRGALMFVDGSTLHVREFVKVGQIVERLTYAYHYMDADQRLIFRYDNTDHFPQLPTHPHHKHEGAENKVVVSPAPTLADVLSEIELQVQLN